MRCARTLRLQDLPAEDGVRRSNLPCRRFLERGVAGMTLRQNKWWSINEAIGGLCWTIKWCCINVTWIYCDVIWSIGSSVFTRNWLYCTARPNIDEITIPCPWSRVSARRGWRNPRHGWALHMQGWSVFSPSHDVFAYDECMCFAPYVFSYAECMCFAPYELFASQIFCRHSLHPQPSWSTPIVGQKLWILSAGQSILQNTLIIFTIHPAKMHEKNCY